MYYKSLFQLTVDHAYFLDNGNKKYLRTPDMLGEVEMAEEEKEKVYKEYSIDSFLNITPTAKTKQILKNYRLKLVKSAKGIEVLTATSKTPNGFLPVIDLEDDLLFTFELRAVDSNFYNYTHLDGIDLKDVIDLGAVDQPKCYFFTNKISNTKRDIFETIGNQEKSLVNNVFLFSGKEAIDSLKPIYQEEDNVVSQTIFEIENNETLTPNEKELRLKQMITPLVTMNQKRGVIGYFQIQVKGKSGNNILTINNNDPRNVIEPSKKFKLSFLNKKAFWEYVDTSRNTHLITNNQYWMSKNGYIKIDESALNFGNLTLAEVKSRKYNYTNPTHTVTESKDINGVVNDYSLIYL